MAQPTRSDDPRGRSRLSHNNLRRKQWRRRLPRARRRRPRRSGKFFGRTSGGAQMEHPNFFCLENAALPTGSKPHHARSPTSQADVPGGRVRCDAAVSRSRNPNRKGGFRWRRKQPRARRKRPRRSNPPPSFAEAYKGRSRGPFSFLVRVSRRGPVPDPDPLDQVERLDAIDDVHAVHHVAEHRVARIEMRLRRVRDEEL